MNTQNIIRENYDTYTPMYEYRGFTIYKGQTPIWYKDMPYSDGKGNKCNDKKPFYRSLVTKNKSTNFYNQIYVADFGGNNGLENEYTPENWEYSKKQIDRYIEVQREYKQSRIEVLKNTRFAVYECNNVTIRVLITQSPYNKYENYCDVWVNERSLTRAYLKPNFTFNDVLKEVLYRPISNYKSYDFKENIKTNYIKNKTFEKIDLTILPVYEFLGVLCKFNDLEFIPMNVHESENGFRFECVKSDDVDIPIENVNSIEIIGEPENTLVQYTCLKNKLRFLT